MKPDFEMLHEACFEAARRSMWDVRPIVSKMAIVDNAFSMR